MPYRFDLPDEASPLTHVMYNIGSDALMATRRQLFQAIYEKNDTKLQPRERELLRTLSAKNIGCQICLAARFWRDLPGFSAEIPEVFYQNVTAVNFEWPGFTLRERILLELSERFENDYKSINGDDALWANLNANFSGEEIGDALLIISCLGAMGHVMTALGIGSVCDIPDPKKVSTIVKHVAHNETL